MPDAEATRFTWTLPAGVGLASAPAVSPDGRYVAFTGSDGARTGSSSARWAPTTRWRSREVTAPGSPSGRPTVGGSASSPAGVS